MMKRRCTIRRTPLKRMGKNKARETAKYWPLRRKFIEDHPFCEFPESHHIGLNINDGSPVISYTPSCTNRTVSIHHMKGQNWRVMNDTRYWLAACPEHHAWIEDHKREARKRGLILYK